MVFGRREEKSRRSHEMGCGDVVPPDPERPTSLPEGARPLDAAIGAASARHSISRLSFTRRVSRGSAALVLITSPRVSHARRQRLLFTPLSFLPLFHFVSRSSST